MEVDESVEAEIDALLAKGEYSSVVDALLAIPPRADMSGDAWQKLIHERMQFRVSRMMRKTLEGDHQNRPGVQA
ncbi:hypothetical protein GCM10023174_14430 [Chelativorans composti]|jgi:hypothetical protein|uniref:Uncharacterized protein n=1 Tax=Chelativorans composti TaxID=768533 RepID=A0ABW5DGR7_9HYPH